MSGFKIRENLPKATVLNRSLLIGIGALVAFFVLWAIVSAFQTPTRSSVKKSFLNNGSTSNIPVSPLLSQLPKNYQDVNGIKKYVTPTDTIPPEVSQELSSLRSQEAAMQAKLAQLQSHPAATAAPVSAGEDAAIKSDLFFSSSKPASNLFDSDNAKKQNQATFGNNLNTPYAQQNMQAQKMGFMQDTGSPGDVYNKYDMIKPASPYEVQAGTILAANLLTAINTSLPGDIIAQVRQDVYDTVKGKYLLIPKGSKLLGKYDSSVAYGQERILIAFDRIVRPDGTSIQLSNFNASDDSGASGFNANVDNHWSKILGAATISTMLSFGAGVVADRNSGSNTYYPSAQSGAITGAAGSVSQTGQSLTSRAMDIQPTLTVPAGFNFNVIVNKDMILEPYAGKTL